MRFLDLFAGIGGFRLGMEQAGHKCLGYVEWDKFARKSYEAIHDTEGEWTRDDITTVSDDDLRLFRGRVDVICGGFPCQAFSVAGKRKGFEDTRGTLFFEIARFAREIRPKYIFMENVKGLLNHDGGNTFRTILGALDELGYDAEWQVCNSKDFGVAQNRERVFIIGHLRGTSTRKVFPVGGVDGTADSKIIKVGNIRKNGYSQSGNVFDANGICPTLCSSELQKDPVKVMIGASRGRNPKNTSDRTTGAPTEQRLEINKEGISNCLTSVQKDNYVLIKEATKKGYAEATIGDSINFAVPGSETRRGRVGKGVANTLDTSCNQGTLVPIGAVKCLNTWREDGTQTRMQDRIYDPNGLSVALTSFAGRLNTLDNYRIRKLTPRECFRLQGFPDWAFDKAAEVNSDSQLYKQAGNSVTVNVIYEIAKRLGV